MSRHLKKKCFLMIAAELLCVILLGTFLNYMQVSISANEQAAELQKKISPLVETVENATIESADHIASYDAMYQAKATTLAYMIDEEIDGPNATSSLLKKYQKLLNVTNAYLIDKKGNILVQAEDCGTDFTRSRFNQLRTVFSDAKPSVPFEVIRDEQTYRYYGAKIDADRMAVIEQDPAELSALLEDTVTWKSILRNVTVGTTGYTMAISARDYTFLYHPDEEVIGQDALDAGIQVEDLEDNTQTWMELYGERYLCSVAHIDDTYVICSIPEKEIQSSCNITVIVVLSVFFAIITLIVTYAIFIMQEQEKEVESPERDYKKIFGFYFNKTLGTKVVAIVIVGLICVFGVSLYMQTLFSLSRQSLSNTQHVEELQATAKRYEENVEFLQEQYNTRYLNKCRAAAYILTQKPEYRSREELERLSQVLDIDFISFFDETGTITATNSYYMNFKLSQDKEDQSYEFNKLLAGGDYLVQEAQKDEVLGNYCQYIGVSIRNDEGLTEGFVQICVNPEKLEHALENLQIDSVLDGVQVGSNGFAFAVNKKDNTIAYYPDEKYLGQPVTEYGVKETQIRDGFSDYLTIGSKKYYASCLETENYFIYACVPAKEIGTHKFEIALISTAFSFVMLLIISLTLCLRKKDFADTEESAKQTGPMIRVQMPDGQLKKTQDIASRWSNAAMLWEEQTPEQKMTSVLKTLLSLYAVIICITYLIEKQNAQSHSMFLYIINGGWERGLNIFAITGCIFIICMVVAVTLVVQRILRVLSTISSAQGETIFRLLSNFIKYASVIALMYYCFALLGVDTGTLLASAGIVGLMISLGAQKLVADILAGLFIIFEGEFRVGDIISIGDWRGTVVEIGIRTTKLEEAGGNIKVINNSSISGVTNMTKQYSFAACDFGIEYNESLERVEYILKKELPLMKERIPSILDGPYYKGVTSLGDNSVNIKIVAQCTEGDRIQLMRDLNREMKLLFDKYEINIPYPQVVVNHPAECKKATEWQKAQAEEFAQEQKELAKKLEEEQ